MQKSAANVHLSHGQFTEINASEFNSSSSLIPLEQLPRTSKKAKNDTNSFHIKENKTTLKEKLIKLPSIICSDDCLGITYLVSITICGIISIGIIIFILINILS